MSQIGRLAVRWSRPLQGTPKTVTMRREADGCYVTFSCAQAPTKPLPMTGQQTGLDLGVESFATLADGSQIASPRSLRVAELNLKRAQRRVDRRHKGSQRRRKAVTMLAKAQQQVRRARQVFHPTTALTLVRQYDTVEHEALQVANMLTHHQRATSSSDAGWSGFLTILAFTAAAAGKQGVAVPPACTAPTGSGCGVLVHQGWCTKACPSAGIGARTVGRACIGTRTLPAPSCASGEPVRPGWPFRRERGPLGRASPEHLPL